MQHIPNIMRRLSPDLALSARQENNCIGQRTLTLREKGIPVIENLGVVGDSFDSFDLSANAITVLGVGFPRLERLSCLYLGSNKITKIQKGLADALPNLQTLILTSNRISTRANLNVAELALFKKLEVLSLLDNPISSDPDLRMFLLHHVPSLRFINFRRVTDKERRTAKQLFGNLSGPKNKSNRANKKKRKSDSADGIRKKPRL